MTAAMMDWALTVSQLSTSPPLSQPEKGNGSTPGSKPREIADINVSKPMCCWDASLLGFPSGASLVVLGQEM